MESSWGESCVSHEQKWEQMSDARSGKKVYDLSFAYRISWDHPERDLKEALHLLLCVPSLVEQTAIRKKEEEHKDVKEGLTEAESRKIRWLIVLNPNTPPPVLDCFVSQESEPMILERIAEHPRTSPGTLHRLAFHPDPGVRAALAENNNTPFETLSLLAKDNHPDVRYRIAEGYHIPIEMLQELAEDENPYVAQRAHLTLGRLSAHEVVRGDFDNKMKVKRSAG